MAVTFDEALDEDSLPSPDDFRITVAAYFNDVASVAISGTTVTLTLQTPITHNNSAVRVRYTSTASRPIQDLAGNDVATFSDQNVHTATPPATAGVLVDFKGGCSEASCPHAPTGNAEAGPGQGEITVTWTPAAIGRAARLGIVAGVGDGRFEPARLVTRVELAAPLVRLWQTLGRRCRNHVRMPFADVSVDSGARTGVACLRDVGVTAGTGARTYSPQRVATRAEAATMLARMWSLTGHECPDAELAFDDVAADSVHADGIACLHAIGVTNGTGAATFSPDRLITRAELAALAVRLHDLAKEAN